MSVRCFSSASSRLRSTLSDSRTSGWRTSSTVCLVSYSTSSFLSAFMPSKSIGLEPTVSMTLQVYTAFTTFLTSIFQQDPGKPVPEWRRSGFCWSRSDGGGGDNCSYKTCKAPVKSSPPTNQHPVFYRPDALPVAQPTVSKHWRENITFHGLAYPKLTWGLPALSLTTNSSPIFTGRMAFLSKHRRERVSRSTDLLTPSSPGGLRSFS